MVEVASRGTWGEERGGVPAGGHMPAGLTIGPPPPFLVYKHRLYVLARKPPVLDHRQASIDEIFSEKEKPRSVPVHRVAYVAHRAATERPVANRGHSSVRHISIKERKRQDRPLPAFVPRERLSQSI